MLNLIHTRGALLFSLFFTNWKSGRRAIRVQTFILAYTGIKLAKLSIPGAFISELADYLIFSYLSCSRKGVPMLYIKTALLYWYQECC